MCYHHPLLCSSHDTPPPEIYPLSLHDALPISPLPREVQAQWSEFYLHAPGASIAVYADGSLDTERVQDKPLLGVYRSEEHTSELQSRPHLVCRLLREKKNALTTTIL